MNAEMPARAARSGRRRGAALTALVVTALSLLVGAKTLPAHGDAQQHDGTDTIALLWDGTGSATVTDSFFGAPVAVPGDRASRTVIVRNDGPMDGSLRASIIDVTLRDADTPDHGAFYEDLTLHWETASSTGDASFLALDAAGTTTIGEIALESGASTAITLTYELPVEATSGNRALGGMHEASFAVHLQISGDLPDEPAETPQAPGGAPNAPGGAPDVPGGAPDVPGGAPAEPRAAPDVPGGAPDVPGGAPDTPGGGTDEPGGPPPDPDDATTDRGGTPGASRENPTGPGQAPQAPVGSGPLAVTGMSATMLLLALAALVVGTVLTAGRAAGRRRSRRTRDTA